MTEDSIPAQLALINERLDRGDKKMRQLSTDVGDLKTGQEQFAKAMQANTEMTADIRDVVTAGRVGSKVVKWLGAMAIAGASIWSVIYALTHDGKLPHQ